MRRRPEVGFDQQVPNFRERLVRRGEQVQDSRAAQLEAVAVPVARSIRSLPTRAQRPDHRTGHPGGRDLAPRAGVVGE
ncbi:hypothetical protein ACFV6F_17525 [Kitasatospora phosalacinea]|uniref:hypothetical protein n=1 Tax=Kitasatospora phosalacinea TaxID=2065 RepID=UPI00364DDC43